MKIKITFLIVCSYLVSQFIPTVQAGGGRMMLYTMQSSPYNVKEGRILAQVYKDGAQNTGWSIGEKMEFRIVNPQPGDYCKTDESPTKENGFIGAWCYANSAREMEVYLYSLDLSDRSSSYILNFIDPPKATATPTAKPVATKAPTIAPTITPTTVPTAKPVATPASTPKNSVTETATQSTAPNVVATVEGTTDNFWQFAFLEIKKYFAGWFEKK
jgi:hypothetical protein